MPATILQQTNNDWQIQYHFCIILQKFYAEYWKRMNHNEQHLLLGVQTLLHVYQIGWSRRYSVQRILILCLNAQMYFFEYLSQWNKMVLPLRTQDMLIFIYDHVFIDEDREVSTPWNPDYETCLNHLTIILKKLPKLVQKPTVRMFEKIFMDSSIYGSKCES